MDADFAITSGVHGAEDVLKGLMAGAKVTMLASALPRQGLGHLGEIRAGVEQWMEEHNYVSVRQLQGSIRQQHVGAPAAFERTDHTKVLQSWRPDPAGATGSS